MPAGAQLEPFSVHLWWLDLDGAGAMPPVLSASELARAGRILDPVRARRWARARGSLRALLGGYLDREPAALEFTVGPQGKPGLEGGPCFSLSHSGDLALVAVARFPVGVDLELERPGRTIDLTAWVRREAAAKCSGAGLWVQPEPERRARWIADLAAGEGSWAALACARTPRAIYGGNSLPPGNSRPISRSSPLSARPGTVSLPSSE